ncbi:MAG: CoA ester lyase [Alphaproteobacteria bacterium]
MTEPRSARRSALFMPGANGRALAKARELPADVVIVDLEDAVAPDAKVAARAQAVAALGEGGYGARELVMRVNGADTDWGADDLGAAAASAAHAVLLPKVERAEQVQAAARTLPPGKGIWAMIETPRGVLNVAAIAQSSDRLECLVAGTSDLTTDLHARHTPDRMPMLTSLSLILLAGRAAGLTLLDGVYLDIKDAAGFRAVCEQGRTLGFDGKTLIHPTQVEPCNAVFGPADTEIDWARRAIAAYDDAMAAGSGLAVLDGKLVENLHVEEARRILARATMIAD